MTAILTMTTKSMRRFLSPARSSSTALAATTLVSPANYRRCAYYYSVLVPIVMEAEASPFVEHLELKPLDDLFPSHTPFLAFSGSHKDTKITVITMGKDTIYETGVDNVSFRTNHAQTCIVQFLISKKICVRPKH